MRLNNVNAGLALYITVSAKIEGVNHSTVKDSAQRDIPRPGSTKAPYRHTSLAVLKKYLVTSPIIGKRSSSRVPVIGAKATSGLRAKFTSRIGGTTKPQSSNTQAILQRASANNPQGKEAPASFRFPCPS